MPNDTDSNTQLKLREQLFEESRVMAEYALANGEQIPVDTLKAIDAFALAKYNDVSDLEPLILAHQKLSTLIKPALPRTLLLLDREQKSKKLWLVFGPLPIIRQLMSAALLSLTLFIGFSLFEGVAANGGNMLKNHGWTLLKNLIFFLSAAGLGASFAALYKANSYIEQGTFDPAYHASYWIRFCLGLISGLVLSVMVADNVLDVSSETTDIPLENSTLHSASNFLDPAFIRPMLAMLGGFSADLLYTVLNRLVETIGSLFQGSSKNLLDIKQQEADIKLASNTEQNRIELATKLVSLQREIGPTSDPTEIQAKIDKLLRDVMPDGKGG